MEPKNIDQHFIQGLTSNRYQSLDGDLLINGNIVQAQSQASRVPQAIISRVGLTKVNLSGTLFQGATSSYSMGIQIIQADNNFYWLDVESSLPSLTLIPSLPSSQNRFLYTDTFTGGVISIDGAGYSLAFNKVTKVLTTTHIVGANWVIPSSISFTDGYVIISEYNSRFFHYSDLNDTTFTNTLFVAGTAGDVDNIAGIAIANRELFVFGQKHSEVWYNTSPDVNTVFTKQDGRVHAQGLFSQNSISVNGVVYNACRGDTNFGVFAWSPNGAERISVGYIDQALEKAISAYVFNSYERNELFVHIVIDGNQHYSWSHSSKSWSIRQYPSLAIESIRVNNKSYLICLDGVYLLSGGTDNGREITVTKQTSHLYKDGNRLFFRMAEFDLGGQVANAVSLETSDDGGYTWRNQMIKTGSIIGQYNRYRFHHLGYSRNRVFRLRFSSSDEKGVGLYNAYLQIEVGSK
jgi:hypothetical protein